MRSLRPYIKDEQLTNGPGKLTQALNITMEHKGLDLTNVNSDIFICDAPPVSDEYIQATPRIGISQGKDKLWRFILSKNFLPYSI